MSDALEAEDAAALEEAILLGAKEGVPEAELIEVFQVLEFFWAEAR